MPKEAFLYALEYGMYEEHKIRRYGFHGTSHSYLLKEAAKLLNKEIMACNIITLHLGNGASACAIKEGKSIDTSMGFTPLEGLVMGSRCGDIDPEIVLYMQRTLGMSLEEVDQHLNKKSGLLGICGHNDVREIIEDKSEKSTLALNIMVRRIQKYIGAYSALLGRVDAVVFSGGIGEHAIEVRRRVLDSLDSLGIAFDSVANEQNASCITKPQSRVAVYVIATNEELEIAKQSYDLLQSKGL
jgi:acetate kinase